MKRIFFLLATVALYSCNSPRQEAKEQSNEVEYSEDQFRRFTYFFQSDDENIDSLFQEVASNIEKQFADQVADAKLYQQDRDYFLVVDAAPVLNSESLFGQLSKDPSFTTFITKAGLNHSSALERIYKFEQKKVYASQEGQLKQDLGPYKRFVWTLLLEEDPELMAEYRRVHGIGMAWPEITNNMKTIGVKDMEIYLHESQAILVMDTKPGFDLEEVAPKWQQLPREQEWQAYVAKFQRTDPGSSIQEKWKTMNEID